ncbi:hypothetical protein AX769_01210 [Frondihabitans sp. PAMC 28766]|nr:hypothetical protein AX769_01210 [Frondihabitans sp. PAMC 28766]
MDARGAVKVKAYFDGFSDGLAGNLELVKSFAGQLGYAASSDWIDDHVRNLRAPILSLDATAETEARVKIYTIFTDRSIADLERQCESLPGYAAGDATRLLQGTTSKWDVVLDAPGTRPLMCWSFTSRNQSAPSDLTLYLPFNRYQPSASGAVRSLAAIGAPAALINVCRLAVSRGGTDADTNPFHWLALKFGSARGSMTLYVAASQLDRIVRTAPRPGP